MGVTRQEMRRRVGELTGDLDIWTATATGSTSSFVDILNGDIENNSYKGRFGYFSGGTSANLNTTVRVTANTKSATSLDFTPAVTSATVSGDVLELYNRDGQGPKPEEIHRVLNYLVESVSNAVLTEVVGPASTFDYQSPFLTIPSTWRRVVAIEYQEDADRDVWESFEEGNVLVDRDARTIRLNDYAAGLAANTPSSSVRLRGYMPAQPLINDDDITGVNAEWLENAAVARILLRIATSERVDKRRAADYRATAQYHQTLANTLRIKVPKMYHGAGWVLEG